MNRTPTERASRWLEQFGSAVAASDVRGAAAQFHAESYWRDLVSFTWNIKTMEGADEIGAMLGATAEKIRPSAWSLVDGAAEVDGAVEAWFKFDTALSRGIGHLRLKGERSLTLLTRCWSSRVTRSPRVRRGRTASSTARSSAGRTGSTAGRAKHRHWADRCSPIA